MTSPRSKLTALAYNQCGLYYNPVTIVIDDSSVISKWSFMFIDDPRVVIYDRNMFMTQATDRKTKQIRDSRPIMIEW